MRHLHYLAAVLAISCSFSATASQPSQAPATSESDSQAIGLVLSGGGAKGIAHIGLIQALEDNDIPIDYITGTSIGAVVGGLYAAGYSPAEMMDLITSRSFSYWAAGQIDPSLTYYFSTDEPSPVMLNVPIPSRRDSLEQARTPVMASLISPMPMNFAFTELFSGVTAQCGADFDRLFVPFRCVASDADARHKVVLSHGDLGYSIRASMSFPIVFQPTHIDSMYLYDGGLYDNFPIGVMLDTFAPDFVLAINVSTEEIGPQTSIMDQLDNLVMQSDEDTLDPALGISIRYHLNEFGLLDFAKAKQIYQIGYDVAMQNMDSIKSRIHTRVPAQERALRRAVFKSKTPYLRFDQVDVRGVNKKQNEYIKYLFTHNRADTISIDQARSSYYRAISPGRLRDLVPHAYYNDSTGLFRLDLLAAAKDNMRVGFGGYITSSTQSYVYLQAGYSTMSFRSVAANLGIWIGQSYLGAQLTSRLYLPTHIPSAAELQVVAFRQKYFAKDYWFFEEKAPSYVYDHEYFARLKWAWAVGSLCDMEAGVGYGHLNDSFYQPNHEVGYLTNRDKCKFNLGQLFLRFTSNTLDDYNFPTQGRYYNISAMGVLGSFDRTYGDEHLSTLHNRPKWVQLESVTRHFYTMGNHFTLGVESDVMLSTRKLLGDYNASIVTAPGFLPTPSSYNSFNAAFRANSFVAVGLTPIYRYNAQISARLSSYCFLPMRKIVEGADGSAQYAKGWLNHPQYFGEFDVCYKLPFATIAAYCNYSTSPARNWSGGISFGVFLPAPRFLR